MPELEPQQNDARGAYYYTPFTKGNTDHMTSGHRSPRVYGELAQHLTAGLLAERPDLAAYPESVAAWATAEAQATLLRRHLAEVGPIGEDGQPRKSSIQWSRQLEKSAAERRKELGLDPRSEAQLAKDRLAANIMTGSLHQLAERGRADLAARAAEGQVVTAPDVAGEILERVAAEGKAKREAEIAEFRRMQEPMLDRREAEVRARRAEKARRKAERAAQRKAQGKARGRAETTEGTAQQRAAESESEADK